jgi:hypothetical protein
MLGILVLCLASLGWGQLGPSFYVTGPQQGVFGSSLSFLVSSFPAQCAILPVVRVTGPQNQIVSFSSSSCVNGVTTVSFLPCAEGTHVVAVMDNNAQIAALSIVIQPQPTIITYVDGPAIQTIFDFGDIAKRNL